MSVSGSSAERLAALRVSSSKKAFNYHAELLLDNIFISPAVLPGWMGQQVPAVEHPMPCHCVTPAVFPKTAAWLLHRYEPETLKKKKKAHFVLLVFYRSVFFLDAGRCHEQQQNVGAEAQ